VRSVGPRPDPRLVGRLRAAAVGRLAGIMPSRQELAEQVEDLIDEEMTASGERERRATVEAVLDEALGLGPLEALLRDRSVTEVVVNGAGSAFVERDGRLEPVETGFLDDAHLLHVIDRVLAPLGRRIDASSPMVDARLADGSRINAIIPPLALDGPCLSIRRFPGAPLKIADLTASGTLDDAALTVLVDAVSRRENILVTGGTGSGKTTTLAALAATIDPAERVITIEDAAELRVGLPHVVRLESRPASVQGTGEVTIRDLVRNALRMRPDRIVVGEVRGPEAIDMLVAMTTGHAGSMSTVHASSSRDALRRLQLLAAMGNLEVSYEAISDQVAAAIDLVVHQLRLADGRRRVASIDRVSRSGTHDWSVATLARWVADTDRFEVSV
jgi:pilus assembly protein CpaF